MPKRLILPRISSLSRPGLIIPLRSPFTSLKNTGTPISENDYDDSQIEEFREVLYTMQPNEVEDWLKSLELRKVALPLVLKEEAYALVAEHRTKR